MKCWWWLSFADPARPRGAQFLGVAVVFAIDLGDAMSTAWRSNCNPGGQVGGRPVPESLGPPPPELDHRLVSNPDDLDRVTRAWTGSGVERDSRRKTGGMPS
jgi:hypothetical protein